MTKVKLIKKSLNFDDVNVRVDSADQLLAVQNAPKELVELLKSKAKTVGQFEIVTAELPNGNLYLTKKTEGLYNGVFKDQNGNIKAKFDNSTIEMVSSDMVIKGLYKAAEVEKEDDEKEEPQKPMYIRIKCGDFELELRKALSHNRFDQPTLQKAFKSWKANRNNSTKKDSEALEDLIRNWNIHKEDFNQILFAMEQQEG